MQNSITSTGSRAFPPAESVCLNFVNCLIDRGHPSRAIEVCIRGLAARTRQSMLLDALARSQMAAGQLDDAQRSYERILRTTPRQLQALWDWVELPAHRQDWHAAADHFRQVIQHHADAVSGHVNLLVSLKEQGEFDAAKAHFNSVSRSSNNNPDVISAIAALLMAEAKTLPRLNSQLALACELAPDNAVNWLNRSACLRNLKHNLASHSVLQRGLLRHPEHSDLLHAYGQSLAELGRGQSRHNRVLGQLNQAATSRTER